MQRSRLNEVTCRACGLATEPFPEGWYQLSVNDMDAPNGKYRYLGVFCSVVCLAHHLPEMAQVETDIQRKRELQRKREQRYR